MLVLCLPSRGANPYDGDEQDDGRDPHKDPFESMEQRCGHRVFGLEKSHSRYEPPIAASAIRTSAVMAAIAMQGACSARRLDSCARANWSFSTSSFSESACRPSGSDAGTVSPSSVLAGASSTLPSATCVSASGTERLRSHLETVCLTTFSLSASSSWDRLFDFLRAWMFSFRITCPFSCPVPTLPHCYPQMAHCRKQRDVTAGRNSAIA